MNFKPYLDKIENGKIIREFDSNVKSSELIWHVDESNRKVKVIHNDDWKFQFDNELPFVLENEIDIKKDVYHRLIKGNGKLIIEITEY